MTISNLSLSRLAVIRYTQVLAAAYIFVLQIHGFGVVADSNAHAASATREVSAKRAKAPVSIRETLEDYDLAFQSRNIEELQRFLADDIVMYEQGGQNIGKADVLNNHLVPELRSFQELNINHSDIRVRESAVMAIITRQFTVKGKRQDRPFFIKGCETLGWDFRKGRWQLTSIHMSFPPSR